MLRTVLRRGGAAMRQAALAEGSTGNLLRLSVAERERSRRRRRDPGRDEFFVPTPESLKWLDSVTLPMILTAAAVALFTKLLMMLCRVACRKIGSGGRDAGDRKKKRRDQEKAIREMQLSDYLGRGGHWRALNRPEAACRCGTTAAAACM
ncbi:uncharacterized protein [Aegilops tauschii subsp. strangulata]|uniref:uncharacterized protein isoform X2 n=1 Tax=Aegilops tauschii subsp. strangulata TaxID=200361 RepID=UPI00098BAA67|nr:uncharacterized protein LOC109786301 isoform X2 [Aegilops tauschii subsp. strangulata]